MVSQKDTEETIYNMGKMNNYDLPGDLGVAK